MFQQILLIHSAFPVISQVYLDTVTYFQIRPFHASGFEIHTICLATPEQPRAMRGGSQCFDDCCGKGHSMGMYPTGKQLFRTLALEKVRKSFGNMTWSVFLFLWGCLGGFLGGEKDPV